MSLPLTRHLDIAPFPTARLPRQRLSRELRLATRADHQRAESALVLGDWTSSRTAYGALLTVLRSFHAPAEARLRSGEEWHRLTPPVDVRSRERAHLLSADLEQLGLPVPGPAAHAHQGAEPLSTGLGWLYVVEGSRLGGAIIARHARAALGEALPVSFFSGDGRAPGVQWRQLQLSLDAFGEVAGATRRAEVVSAAGLAFASFASCLMSGARPS
jgi:heme oxygenase